MVLATELTINLFNAIIAFAGFVIVMIGSIWSINASIDKKIEEKADQKQVIKIEEDMECLEKTKADTEYVKEQFRAVHHRINDNAAHTLGILNQLQKGQDTIQEDLKEILKTMPRK
jgi:sorbitol-specific phosphotransferase system component IIBC